jgi:DNA-directed RNA polymerase specialized sigma24 family protein
VLVAGMGPAGFSLAHHLMNDGHSVAGIDGLKIEPLAESFSGVRADGSRVPFEPIRDVSTLYEALDDRVMAGFGGVAEYGITVRWDKNFLKLVRLLLERRDFDAVRKEKGRLRSYLLTSLKHFLASEHRRATAAKRGKGQRLIALEELSASGRREIEPTDPLSADRLYERRWALTLMEQVLRRLKDEYCTAGNAPLFDWLKQLLPDEPGAPPRSEIAANLGMTENAVRQALYRFRHRYQVLLREEISHTVAIASDIEDELRHLIAVLRA